jgi:hypothetical protein
VSCGDLCQVGCVLVFPVCRGWVTIEIVNNAAYMLNMLQNDITD